MKLNHDEIQGLIERRTAEITSLGAEITAAHEAVKRAQAALYDVEEARRKALTNPAIEQPRPGSVIKFRLRMDSRAYDYAALRVGDHWFTTGSTCPRNGYTWAKLWSDLIRGRLESFEVASFDETNPGSRVTVNVVGCASDLSTAEIAKLLADRMAAENGV